MSTENVVEQVWYTYHDAGHVLVPRFLFFDLFPQLLYFHERCPVIDSEHQHERMRSSDGQSAHGRKYKVSSRIKEVNLR